MNFTRHNFYPVLKGLSVKSPIPAKMFRMKRKKKELNKMKERTKNIIRNYFRNYSGDYRRGNYLYRYDVNTGIFYRCREELYGKSWIDNKGRRYDAWQEIDRD